MIDRGIIKWQPFNSCFSGINVINDITKEKDKFIYPTLSEDQLKIIEEKIKDAYILKLNINLKYFTDGEIKFIVGKINYINFQEKKICLNNINIYFKQILDIN